MAFSRVHPPWGFLASHSWSLGSDALAKLSTSSGAYCLLVRPAEAPATKAVMSTAGLSIVTNREDVVERRTVLLYRHGHRWSGRDKFSCPRCGPAQDISQSVLSNLPLRFPAAAAPQQRGHLPNTIVDPGPTMQPPQQVRAASIYSNAT